MAIAAPANSYCSTPLVCLVLSLSFYSFFSVIEAILLDVAHQTKHSNQGGYIAVLKQCTTVFSETIVSWTLTLPV